MIKIIFISDIVGKIGRNTVRQYLPLLKKKYNPDLVIANAENLAHGIGFTSKTLDEMRDSGVDFFTTGNHAWKKAGSDDILNDKKFPIIRPANYKDKRSGVGYKVVKIGKKKLVVVNLLGRVFILDELESPFKVMEKIIKKAGTKNIIVDFHAEATSEKVAFGQYFDGKVSAVIGTHTHVQTADDRILKGSTAYISDVGMVGYSDSIIGANKEQIFNLFLEKGKSSKKHDLPEYGPAEFDAVYLEIDDKKGGSLKMKRINKIIEVKEIVSKK
ncbi:MAG: TIGR00282 family metallophosphoesterase [Candidatus Buchananbacteria bacterium]